MTSGLETSTRVGGCEGVPRNTASCSTSGIGCATTLAEKVIPEFHGFKNDRTTSVSTVNSVAIQHSWTDHMKKSFGEGRLQEAAEAWHRLKASAYATCCDIKRTCLAARQYVVDGLCDLTHAAILSAQSFQDDLETFLLPQLDGAAVHHCDGQAVLLQDTTGRRLDSHSQQKPTDLPTSAAPNIQYQTRPLPTVEVRADGIGMLMALVDRRVQRTALLRRHAPASLQPWTEQLLSGLGGSARPIGALDVLLHTEAGTKFLAAVPVFQELTTFLSGEAQLTMDGGGVHLRSLITGTPSPEDSQGESTTRSTLGHRRRHEVAGDCSAERALLCWPQGSFVRRPNVLDRVRGQGRRNAIMFWLE
ncbi:hypothetical protein HPB50_015543 [Hyalomma asiaticum]|uniref:Uncharacterized protein n=1 Tax=Hyalomma asiaticum TaxID=266040 RepID=A0ACB7S070_HYAAI|nr:hypothetical protein HPB50_015543 [Hyalomma asiaticum]